MRAFLTVVAGVLAVAAARSQDVKQLIDDLGDVQRGEAAEVELLQLGETAGSALADWLGRITDVPRAERELRRLRAALTVIDMLGVDALAAMPALKSLLEQRPASISTDLERVMTTLMPHVPQEDALVLFRRPGLPSDRSEQELVRHMCANARLYQCQSIRASDTTDALLARLRQNEMFAREAAAELLGARKEAAAVDVLRAMLLDRETKPKGWNELRHNGFTVPWDDGFRLRAAEAMLRIAPEDARCITALGCRAALHPCRGMRRQALASLGRLGVQAGEAAADVMLLVRTDPELGAEAFKVLGMMGPAAGAVLADVDDYAQHAQGPIAMRAKSLAAQLRAMGAVPKTTPVVPAGPMAAQLDAFAAEVDHPERGPAAQRALLAAGIRALRPLQDRLRRQGPKTPEAVLRLIAVIGSGLEQERRDELRLQIMVSHNTDSWHTPWSSWTVGAGMPKAVQYECYAMLTIAPDLKTEALLELIAGGDPCARLEAVRRLAADAGARRNEPVVQALLTAARSEHPRDFTYRVSNMRTTMKVNLDERIRSAAAAALVGSQVPAEAKPELLATVLKHDDAAAVAAAIQAWGDASALPALALALEDRRTEVAMAAATALGTLGPAAATAIPALEKALAAAKGDRETALRTALAKVRPPSDRE